MAIKNLYMKRVKSLSDHHPLDVWPLPREQQPMFINEPWLIDESIYFESYAQMQAAREPEDEADNRGRPLIRNIEEIKRTWT